jgi:hypothetical protein
VEEIAKAREQIAAQSASLEIAHKEADVLMANVKAAEEGKVEIEKALVAKKQEADDTGHELTGARDKAEAQEQVAELKLEKNQMKLSAAESKVDTLEALLDALQKRTLEMEARAERDAAKAGMLTDYRNRPHPSITKTNALQIPGTCSSNAVKCGSLLSAMHAQLYVRSEYGLQLAHSPPMQHTILSAMNVLTHNRYHASSLYAHETQLAA